MATRPTLLASCTVLARAVRRAGRRPVVRVRGGGGGGGAGGGGTTLTFSPAAAHPAYKAAVDQIEAGHYPEAVMLMEAYGRDAGMGCPAFDAGDGGATSMPFPTPNAAPSCRWALASGARA